MIESYTGDDPYAFVSYAREDRAEAFAAIEHLDALGYRVSFDEGTDEEALAAATVVVVLVTGCACDSDEVKDEIQLANKKGLEVVAIHLDEVELEGTVGLLLDAADDVKKFRMKEAFYRQQLAKAIDSRVQRPGVTPPPLPKEAAPVIPKKPTGGAKSGKPAAPAGPKGPQPLGALSNFEALPPSKQMMYVGIALFGALVVIGGLIFASGGESDAPIAGTETVTTIDEDGEESTGLTPEQQDALLKESRARREAEREAAKQLEMAGNSFAAGNAHLKSGTYEEAVKSYTQAIDLRADQANYHLARAKAYYGAKNDVEAIKDYSKVIKLEPENLEAYLERGKARQFKDAPRAIKDFTFLLEKDPKNMDVLILRADAKRRGEDYKGAIADYTAALKLKKTYKAYYGRSLTKKKMGDAKGAKLDEARAQKARGM